MAFRISVAIIFFVVVLVTAFQLLTGIYMWSSWLFVLFMIGLAVLGHRRSKRQQARSPASGAHGDSVEM